METFGFSADRRDEVEHHFRITQAQQSETHTRTLTPSLSLTHTLTLTHSLTLSLFSFSLSLSRYLSLYLSRPPFRCHHTHVCHPHNPADCKQQ